MPQLELSPSLPQRPGSDARGNDEQLPGKDAVANVPKCDQGRDDIEGDGGREEQSRAGLRPSRRQTDPDEGEHEQEADESLVETSQPLVRAPRTGPAAQSVRADS